MRDTLFIGHANPQDNEFALWLYSKLALEKYKGWCDLKDLYGGERDFWDEIQNLIRDEAIKYLLVFSKHTFGKDGVLDEYEYARGIAKDFELRDFVIPLRIDDVPYNQRIGINRYNVIDFKSSWLRGLKRLFLKLANDEVPKIDVSAPRISDWILNIQTGKKLGLIKRKEKHYSNWWPINRLPKRMYLFQYTYEAQAQTIIEEGADYPVIRHGNYLVSFEQNIKRVAEKKDNIEINPIDTKEVLTKDVIAGYDSPEFPTLTDSQNLLKRLLKKAFKNLMYERGLARKVLSNDQCFFYRHHTLYKNWAIAKYPNRKSRRKLVGRYYDGFWHYAVSAQVRLSPFICFSLKSHILFSDDGFNIWDDDSRLHSARRSKGRRWFNKEWRDLIMAFLASLAEGKDKVIIKLEGNFLLEMPLLTREFYANVGYDEPETKERLSILYERDESLYELDELPSGLGDQEPETSEALDDE